MKFKLMQHVYIQSDTFNFGAPIGEIGYIARVDRDVDQAEPYRVRIPSKREFYWLPECDIVSADEWLANEAEQVVNAVLINHSLETKDRETFILQPPKRPTRRRWNLERTNRPSCHPQTW